MIDLVSTDRRFSLQLSCNVETDIGLLPGYKSVFCSMTYDFNTLELLTSFEERELARFAADLSQIHTALKPGSSTTLWSSHAKLALGLTLEERGAVWIRCILTERKRSFAKSLSAVARADQTYLKLLSDQALALSQGANYPL